MLSSFANRCTRIRACHNAFYNVQTNRLPYSAKRLIPRHPLILMNLAPKLKKWLCIKSFSSNCVFIRTWHVGLQGWMLQRMMPRAQKQGQINLMQETPTVGTLNVSYIYVIRMPMGQVLCAWAPVLAWVWVRNAFGFGLAAVAESPTDQSLPSWKYFSR